MFATAPLFGKFHSPLKDAALSLQCQRPLHHLESLCAPWIDPSLLAPNQMQANSRERIYTPKLTFLTFLDQVLHPGSPCRHADFRQGQYLGAQERLLTWFKPKNKPANMPGEQWEKLPAQLTVRRVRFRVPTRNGRCKKITLVTTLLDPVLWPIELLAALYARRWQIELFLRDIKTTLQMERLSCLSPEMCHKELEMHLIAYNLIRAFMGEAALTCHVPLQRLSFKGSLDTACEYARAMAPILPSYRQRRKTLYREMLAVIAADPVPDRPDRFEPRCQKRRPKRFPFMTRPRRALKAARKDHLPYCKKPRA